MATGETVELDLRHGRWAVSFARAVVESVVDPDRDPPDARGVDPALERERGAFVTLKHGGSLRGCIGRPNPEQSGVQAIREAATGAATNDPRFPPVRPDELDSITVEVSILTPPVPMDSVPVDSYPDAVSIGRDGLIVYADGRSGLLLPQVPVDRGWDTERFLRETCRKAGLPPDSWREDETVVEQFSAQVFREVEPRGDVVPVDLAGGNDH